MFTVPFGTTWFILASRLSQPRNKVRFVHTERKRMGSTLNSMRNISHENVLFFPVPHSLSISVYKTLNVFWTPHSTELRQNYTIWRSHWPTTTLRPLSVSMGLHGTQSRLEQGYFLTKIIDDNVQKFAYQKHPLTMNSFFFIFKTPFIPSVSINAAKTLRWR